MDILGIIFHPTVSSDLVLNWQLRVDIEVNSQGCSTEAKPTVEVVMFTVDE